MRRLVRSIDNQNGNQVIKIGEMQTLHSHSLSQDNSMEKQKVELVEGSKMEEFVGDSKGMNFYFSIHT